VQQLSVNTPPMEANNFIGVDNRQTPVLPANPHDVVRMVSLGGVGNVTRNMYVYEYGDDILIVDCGIGFPEVEMLGVDLHDSSPD
jgi:predicted metal-dependent RNase